jgi:cytochrome c-type biogenesis protein CcmH
MSRAAPFCVALLAMALLVGAAADPNDRLRDPGQEAHARGLFIQVRCIVCQNESIDDSEAPLAHDLRQSIRAQVAQGRSDAQIRDFLVARYGEFILMKPRFSLGNAPLWLTPFAIVLIGVAVMVGRARRAPPTREAETLTADEQARLRSLDGG